MSFIFPFPKINAGVQWSGMTKVNRSIYQFVLHYIIIIFSNQLLIRRRFVCSLHYAGPIIYLKANILYPLTSPFLSLQVTLTYWVFIAVKNATEPNFHVPYLTNSHTFTIVWFAINQGIKVLHIIWMTFLFAGIQKVQFVNIGLSVLSLEFL